MGQIPCSTERISSWGSMRILIPAGTSTSRTSLVTTTTNTSSNAASLQWYATLNGRRHHGRISMNTMMHKIRNKQVDVDVSVQLHLESSKLSATVQYTPTAISVELSGIGTRSTWTHSTVFNLFSTAITTFDHLLWLFNRCALVFWWGRTITRWRRRIRENLTSRQMLVTTCTCNCNCQVISVS